MNQWVLRTVVAVVAALLGGGVVFATLYATTVGAYVTTGEVRQLILLESPYLRDQKWLTEAIRAFDNRLLLQDAKLNTILSRLPTGQD